MQYTTTTPRRNTNAQILASIQSQWPSRLWDEQLTCNTHQQDNNVEIEVTRVARQPKDKGIAYPKAPQSSCQRIRIDKGYKKNETHCCLEDWHKAPCIIVPWSW